MTPPVETPANPDHLETLMDTPPAPLIADEPGVRKALTFYRVMAWIVGVLLVVLICVGVPLKYVAADPNLNAVGASINTYLGITHGWLYMLLLVSAIDLGRRVGWRWVQLVGIALCGTVPFLSFVAEHIATRDVRRRLASTAT